MHTSTHKYTQPSPSITLMSTVAVNLYTLVDWAPRYFEGNKNEAEKIKKEKN